MNDITESIYNTPYEIAMRLLIIMNTVNQSLTKERLFFFDFLSIHSSIVDKNSKSLHPDNPQFGLEYYSKEGNTEQAIHLLIHKKLVDVIYNEDNYYFEINIFGKHLLSLMEGQYKNYLEIQSKKVSHEFLDFEEDEIQKYFEQSIVNWGASR